MGRHREPWYASVANGIGEIELQKWIRKIGRIDDNNMEASGK